jgi:hypothetical protein
MDIVLGIHSLVRWLILVVAVVAIVKFALGWLRRAEGDKMDRGLMSGFSGLMDLQALLGIVALVGGGLTGAGFPFYRIEHAVTMLIAVVVAHLPMRWRNAAGPIRSRNNLLAVLVSLILIFVGIAILSQRPQGGS